MSALLVLKLSALVIFVLGISLFVGCGTPCLADLLDPDDPQRLPR